jgi:hypothetical protein
MVRRRAAFYGTAVLGLSVAVNLLHTASHAGQHIMFLPAWQLAYVTVVIYAAPVVAAVLIWIRYDLAGAWLLVAAMAGSLVFGLLYHFVVPGPDNVFTQPLGPWRAAFGTTAVLLALLQVIGGSVGVWAARRVPRPSNTGSENHPAVGLADSRRRPGSEPR